MIALKRKPTAASPVDGEDMLAALDRRLSTIEADDNELRAAELALGDYSPNGSRLTEAAEALLAGTEFDPNANVVSQLDAIRKKRAVIRRALEIGYSQRERLLVERAGSIFASFFPEVAELERRRLMTVLQLQRINREREGLREKILAAGGTPYLPTDGVEFLGIGDIQDQTWECCERAISNGVVSRAEIEKARSS
ncbi:hypothetical protein HAP47_0020600 [Bradyrhizobium sp. 41S5]|uniref:hypothetical protein n=1 Tax=Bradyrhizobium sp. 41S5 TaxID=1404443 RepID=UPI00156B67AD|nr:hypothetical protein [Bradyrhizobium sp. 41S5]UFX41714.1 hypothetical protein HAP47_0020600 [Bradyrhizobium sp. 41S5]